MSLQDALDFTLAQEGGFVENPNDPGGPTNMGITIETLSTYRGETCTDQDVKDLTVEEASQIYDKDYWKPLECDQLPDAVALVVFDSAVNSGVTRAAKWLQQAVGCLQDGEIGPQTIQAVKQRMTIDTVDAILDERLSFLKSLETWQHFGKGWQNRINDLKEAAHALCT